MVKRCIMMFPNFKNMQIINDLRKKYDPLAEHVKPHITLVFPFESNIETYQLKQYIETVVLDIKSFNTALCGITPSNSTGNYLFLNVKKGSEQIIEIHKRLYSGILREFYPVWLKNTEFIPHMTVGNISESSAFKKAIEETKNIDEVFETTVDTISVEIIDENEDSIIELNVTLT